MSLAAGVSGGGIHAPARLRLRRFGVFLLTFLAVIPIQVQFGGATVGIALLVCGALALSHFASLLMGAHIPQRELHLLALLVGLLIVFLLGSLRIGVQDISMVIMCLYGIVIFGGSMALARQYARAYGPKFIDAALLNLFLVGLLQSAVQIGVLASAPMSDLVYGIVALSDDSSIHIAQGYRSPGLFSSGAAVLGTFNAFVLAIGLTALLRPAFKPSWRRVSLVALASVVQITAIALSGRTGFVVLALYLALLSARGLMRTRPALVGANLFKIGTIIAALVLAFLFYVGADVIEQNLRWSFEFIYSLLEGEGLKTESTNILLGDMFFLPDTLSGLLLGTGNFGRSAGLPYVDSDAGYVLMIFGGGVLGAVLTMSIFALICGQAASMRRRHPPLAFLIVFFVIAVFVINFKDFYFLQNSGVTQLLLFCHALLITESIRLGR